MIEPQYRIKATTVSQWSEWRNINEPIEEKYIYAFQLREYVSKEQYEQFLKQIKLSGGV